MTADADFIYVSFAICIINFYALFISLKFLFFMRVPKNKTARMRLHPRHKNLISRLDQKSQKQIRYLGKEKLIFLASKVDKKEKNTFWSPNFKGASGNLTSLHFMKVNLLPSLECGRFLDTKSRFQSIFDAEKSIKSRF